MSHTEDLDTIRRLQLRHRLGDGSAISEFEASFGSAVRRIVSRALRSGTSTSRVERLVADELRRRESETNDLSFSQFQRLSKSICERLIGSPEGSPSHTPAERKTVRWDEAARMTMTGS